MIFKPGPDSGRVREIEERAQCRITEMSKEEKMTSKYCSVGEHETEEQLFYCKHCKRTFCEEHGDEVNGICNECIEEQAGEQ